MAKKDDKATGIDQYFKEARTWENDRIRQREKSTKIAWVVAGASLLMALASVLAVAALTPLKTVEPYVIRVDNTTGIVDVVAALKDGKTNYEEAINKYFTQLYVRYREGYSKDLVEEYYGNVGILSIGPEQQKYFEWVNPNNLQSPINIYGSYAKVKIQVKSTSFIKPDVALVRYVKSIERGSDRPQLSHWAATISFKYSGSPMLEKDRAINPLGFQVVEYRNDADALATTDATAPLKAETAPDIPAPNVTIFPSAGTGSVPGNIATAPAVPAIR